MKRICGLFACLLFFILLIAQEHFTEGPVWRVTLIRVKLAQMDAYLASLRQATKPLLDEEKRQGGSLWTTRCSSRKPSRIHRTGTSP